MAPQGQVRAPALGLSVEMPLSLCQLESGPPQLEYHSEAMC